MLCSIRSSSSTWKRLTLRASAVNSARISSFEWVGKDRADWANQSDFAGRSMGKIKGDEPT